MVPQRIEIYRLIRERGPCHVDEIVGAFPGSSRKTVLNRLSELVTDCYPGMEVARVYRGVYRAGR